MTGPPAFATVGSSGASGRGLVISAFDMVSSRARTARCRRGGLDRNADGSAAPPRRECWLRGWPATLSGPLPAEAGEVATHRLKLLETARPNFPPFGRTGG